MKTLKSFDIPLPKYVPYEEVSNHYIAECFKLTHYEVVNKGCTHILKVIDTLCASGLVSHEAASACIDIFEFYVGRAFGVRTWLTHELKLTTPEFLTTKVGLKRLHATRIKMLENLIDLYS